MTNHVPESSTGTDSDADADSNGREVLENSALQSRMVISDHESFDAFYDRELPRLVALARALAGAASAEDLAQEAMLSAYRHWSRLATYDRPEAWVRRICVNLATSLLRRRAAEARALLRLRARRQVIALSPSHEAFWDHVRRLPRRQAQAIALRYVYDLQVSDIARTLGCSEGSVKVHLSRARQTLAVHLLSAEEASS